MQNQNAIKIKSNGVICNTLNEKTVKALQNKRVKQHWDETYTCMDLVADLVTSYSWQLERNKEYELKTFLDMLCEQNYIQAYFMYDEILSCIQ